MSGRAAIIYLCTCEAALTDPRLSYAEFKEIRKEWKARKKAEEADRKAREEEQARAAPGPNDPQGAHDGQQTATVGGYAATRLPPIGYQPTNYPAPPNVTMPTEYSSNYIAAGGYNPQSPYQQSHNQVYGQRAYFPGEV